MSTEYEPYKCPGANDNFVLPNANDIYRKDGTCRYAYVSLLMLGDSYMPGLLTLAHSIRKMGSKIDLVIMITDDVSQHARDLLLKIYTKIVKVPYIQPLDGILKPFI